MLLSLLPGLSRGATRRGARNIAFRENLLFGARGEETEGMGRFVENLAGLFGEGCLQFGASGSFAHQNGIVLF